MVEERRSCFSIHFLFSLNSREKKQRKRKWKQRVRTEHQCMLPLSSLTTSTGGLGYCECGEKYFKGLWSTVGAGLLSVLFQGDETHLVPSLPTDYTRFFSRCPRSSLINQVHWMTGLIIASNILRGRLWFDGHPEQMFCFNQFFLAFVFRLKAQYTAKLKCNIYT